MKQVPEWWPNTAHALYVFGHTLPAVYEYDPTADGPECEIITSIKVSYPYYKPGRERKQIAYWRLLDRAALLLFGESYHELGGNSQTYVIRIVEQYLQRQEQI
jgi:hypothetical protein